MKLSNIQKEVLQKATEQIKEISDQTRTIYSVLLWHGFSKESVEFVQSIFDERINFISIEIKMEKMLEENKETEETAEEKEETEEK